MAKPVVTCGADQITAYSGSAQTINLTASATESPTQWQWTMLSVPTGSSADSGSNGNFTDGVATVQNPSFDADASVSGMYVLQCLAYNGEWSDPDSDRESGQTLIIVTTNKLALKLVNDYAWLWGKLYLIPTIRELEDKGLFVNASGEINAVTAKGTPVGADKLIIEDSAAAWAKKSITISSLPSSGGGFSGREQEFTATGGDQSFALTGTPSTNANMLSGYNIIGVFRNGARLRYQATPTTSLEYGYDNGANEVDCKSLTAGDIITVVYST